MYDYPVKSVVSSGYTVCYDQPYSSTTTSADIAACAGGVSYFVGAMSSSMSTEFALGAYGSGDVFSPTYSTSEAYSYGDPGVHWYNHPQYGFGFASSSKVNLNTCDYGNYKDCGSRLCWHLDQNIGGYRAGCVTDLNSDWAWRKVVYRLAGEWEWECDWDIGL